RQEVGNLLDFKQWRHATANTPKPRGPNGRKLVSRWKLRHFRQRRCREHADLHVRPPDQERFQFAWLQRIIIATSLSGWTACCDVPSALGGGITPLRYGALCRGLLSGAMSADRQFSKDDMRKTTDPKFQPPHFAEYLKAASRLDAFAQQNFG